MMALVHFIVLINQTVIYSYIRLAYIEHCYVEGILTDLGAPQLRHLVIIGKGGGASKYCSHTRHSLSPNFPFVLSWYNSCALGWLIILQIRLLFHHFQSGEIKDLIISLLENSRHYEIFYSL